MTAENTQNLAEKIALLLRENQNITDDFLHSSLEKINQRFDAIELNQTSRNSSEIHHSIHPSQEKFADLAEFADEIINGSPNEKACPFEPTGKPCDNCSMCNSRGF